MNQSERYITSGVFSHERPQETHVDVQELINERERLRGLLHDVRLFLAQQEIHHGDPICMRIDAALNDQKGATNHD